MTVGKFTSIKRKDWFLWIKQPHPKYYRSLFCSDDVDMMSLGASGSQVPDTVNMMRGNCQAQVPVQVRSSPVQSRSRSGLSQVQSGPDLDLDPDKTQGPGLTLKSCRPPLPTTTHHPATFKHEGGVPHKNPKSKTDLEWSPQPIKQKKFQVDNDREYTWQSTMSKENIINLIISFNQYCQALSGSLSGSLSGCSLSGSSLASFPGPWT